MRFSEQNDPNAGFVRYVGSVYHEFGSKLKFTDPEHWKLPINFAVASGNGSTYIMAETEVHI
jgi:hypothetical protein